MSNFRKMRTATHVRIPRIPNGSDIARCRLVKHSWDASWRSQELANGEGMGMLDLSESMLTQEKASTLARSTGIHLRAAQSDTHFRTTCAGL